MTRDRRMALATFVTAILGVVGNQISFDQLEVPDVRHVVIVLIFFVLIALSAIATLFAEPRDSDRRPGNPDPADPPVPGPPPGPDDVSTPWSVRDKRISRVLVAITGLGAVALVIWPFVVKHQLQSGPAVTVSIRGAQSVPAKTGAGGVTAAVRVDGTVRRLPDSGYTYWLFQQLHYVGMPVDDDEFYPKAKLDKVGKYHIDLTYGYKSTKENEREVYVLRMPNDQTNELDDLVKGSSAYQEKPCENCTASKVVKLVL